MIRLILIKVIVVIIILAGAPCFSGSLSHELTKKISATNQPDKIEVFILVKNTQAPFELRKELATKYKTNAERHRAGISRLRTQSVQSQKKLLETLRDLEVSDLSYGTKGHWLINGITTQIAVSELKSLVNHPDVLSIQTVPKIETIMPEGAEKPEEAGKISSSLSSNLSTEVQSNLKAIGAPEAWSQGLTGEGSVICSFDTGVDGLHPALLDNWKGHDGDSLAAWYDPFGKQPFPHSLPEAGVFLQKHGTHTMGIMVGHDDITGDTIGVAPDAKWISAAVIDLPYVSVIDAFEWAADPDGDPNTFDDVPDVINHSWGVFNEIVGCDDFLWELIDNTEALGIVNIFAAGNFNMWPKTQTIANPANRANDSLDCFAVGNFDLFHDNIAYKSSRGPSDCDGVSIKPNVVAPGSAILSSVPDGDLDYLTGTSMAAPHVSGAVAILRQYAPNSTPAEIKEALLASCIPYPDTSSSPNNDYGWGLINIPAAINYLTPVFDSDLRISYFEGSLADPGEIATGDLAVTNMGLIVHNVSGTVTDWDKGLSVITPTISFGDIDSGQIVTGDIQFQVAIDDTVSSGQILTINMTLNGDGDYSKNLKIFVRVGQKDGFGKPGFFTHETGAISFTISDFGQYGFGSPISFFPLEKAGFSFNASNNHLFEAAFLIGIDANHISDGARNFAEDPDNDFAVKKGGGLVVSEPGQKADQETVSIFNDSYAENQLGLEIRQKTYSWNNYPDNKFILMEYSIKNNSDVSINNIYAGLFFDWNIISYFNCGGYSADENLGYMYFLNSNNEDSDYRGLAVLNPEGVASYRLRDNAVSEYYTWSELDKFAAISEGLVDTTNTSRVDLAQIISTGPFDLGTGQSDTAVFAIVASNNFDSLKLTALGAKNKYDITTDIPFSENNQIPNSFSLFQNHPNPFNPSTTIGFSLKRRQKVNLSIYNILGKKIVNLIEEKLPAGFHSIEWNGVDINNNSVASGIYFYRLSIEGNSIARKMVLLK